MAKPVVEMLEELSRPFESEEDKHARWAATHDKHNDTDMLAQLHANVREERWRLRQIKLGNLTRADSVTITGTRAKMFSFSSNSQCAGRISWEQSAWR
jgi:hypothetical protein